MMVLREHRTLLDALLDSFAASLRTPDGVDVPAALLWADADGQWKPLMSGLKGVCAHLYEFGSFAPELRRGPAIWLKCIVDRTLPEVSPKPGEVPIFYLPGISRHDLRTGDDCPRELLPLIELQYRGAVWHQRNGRDWTLEAFLASGDGLGLDVAKDNATRLAMLRALPLLATTPLVSLSGRRLEAEDFDKLAIGDPIRDILLWMSASETFEANCDGARWASFKSVCVREFAFDPDAGGPSEAGDKLLHGGGAWDEVWRRFCDSPSLYDGISGLLRRTIPRDLFVDKARRPSLNDEQENLLATELESITVLPHGQLCDRIVSLDNEHRERRGWVWAQLGESPYALALEHLARLAENAKISLSGASVEALAEEYATRGWRCDRAAIDSLHCSKHAKEAGLVARVVRALYEPWLDRTARQLQELMNMAGLDLSKLATGVSPERDACIVFVDGLRFDVGVLLQERLEERGYRVQLSHRISTIPTVTASAKPLASPAHGACYGADQVIDFTPLIRPTGLPASAVRLRYVMTKQGIDVLEPDEIRGSMGSDLGGWTEVGQIDALGHNIGPLLIAHLEGQVDEIIERVVSLFDCGWVRVRLVTDHGWLLLPGGLPKFDLPPSVVESKWARCAMVQGDSQVSAPTYPWHWNSAMRIVAPPGISAFRAGTEYAHGGISLQECVVPELIVERGQDTIQASITSITWRGMRCRVSAATNVSGLQADLRLNFKLAGSSLVPSPKALGPDSEVSFAVSDDKYEGAAATVVIVDSNGHVLDYKTTTVGENA